MAGRWFCRLSALAVALAIAIAAVLLTAFDTHMLADFRSNLQDARPVSTVIRLLAIGGLYLFWPCLLTIYEQRGWISPAARQQLLMCRGRLIAWPVALELLLGLESLNLIHSLITGLLA